MRPQVRLARAAVVLHIGVGRDDIADAGIERIERRTPDRLRIDETRLQIVGEAHPRRCVGQPFGIRRLGDLRRHHPADHARTLDPAFGVARSHPDGTIDAQPAQVEFVEELEITSQRLLTRDKAPFGLIHRIAQRRPGILAQEIAPRRRPQIIRVRRQERLAAIQVGNARRQHQEIGRQPGNGTDQHARIAARAADVAARHGAVQQRLLELRAPAGIAQAILQLGEEAADLELAVQARLEQLAIGAVEILVDAAAEDHAGRISQRIAGKGIACADPGVAFHQHLRDALADIDDEHLADERRLLIGDVELDLARPVFEHETAADHIVVGRLVARLAARKGRRVAIGRAVDLAQILHGELAVGDLIAVGIEPGAVHPCLETAIVIGDDVGDLRAGIEQLCLDKVRRLLRAITGIDAVGIDLQRRRCLPLQRCLGLGPLDNAIFVHAARHILRGIAGQVERARRGRTPHRGIEIGTVKIVARIGHVDQRTDLADPGIPAIGQQDRPLRIHVFAVERVVTARVDDDRRITKIERLVDRQVDDSGDAALDQIGGRRLVDIDPRQGRGGQVLQVEAAADARNDLATVQRGDQGVDPANAHAGDMVVIADIDLDAGNALQRRRRGRIGEFADILGDHRIDDLHRIALDLRRGLETRAQAGDDDTLFRALFLRRGFGRNLLSRDRAGRGGQPREIECLLGECGGRNPDGGQRRSRYEHVAHDESHLFPPPKMAASH